jgi:hypothetical protein
MRIRCCVPFCKRSRENSVNWGEWICQKHWQSIPLIKRKAYKRRAKRDAISEPEARLWRRLKAIAIQRAAGI